VAGDLDLGDDERTPATEHELLLLLPLLLRRE
jgi:hypothetical protein